MARCVKWRTRTLLGDCAKKTERGRQGLALTPGLDQGPGFPSDRYLHRTRPRCGIGRVLFCSPPNASSSRQGERPSKEEFREQPGEWKVEEAWQGVVERVSGSDCKFCVKVCGARVCARFCWPRRCSMLSKRGQRCEITDPAQLSTSDWGKTVTHIR